MYIIYIATTGITPTTGIVRRASEEKYKKVKNNNATNHAERTHTVPIAVGRSVAVKADGTDDGMVVAAAATFGVCIH